MKRASSLLASSLAVLALTLMAAPMLAQTESGRETPADAVAFLPFGLLLARYRWGLFDGSIREAETNTGWNRLHRAYQGVVPPVARGPKGFDAGAKYHIPGNVFYTRYFLARLTRFQFYKAACDTAGWKGPLHRCSFCGNTEVGAKLNAMLKLGASKPSPDALEAFAGERQMTGTARMGYFAPPMAWLEQPNKGEAGGW